MFDVCVVGHVVRDINTLGGIAQAPSPGGTAYYSAIVYASLGLETAVVTRVAPADEDALLGDLRAAGVTVFNLPAERTTVFRNVYDPENPDLRKQYVDAEAGPIGVADLPAGLQTHAFHIGPLTTRDIDLAILEHCAVAGSLVALDAQGLTRAIVDGEVVPSREPVRSDILEDVDILQADDSEILIFTGAASIEEGANRARDAGADIVLVTRASLGSQVFYEVGDLEIEAVEPRVSRDATGCGDTYLAAFLSQQIDGRSVGYSAMFATVAASLNIEQRGPFRGRPQDVAERWLEFSGNAFPLSMFDQI